MNRLIALRSFVAVVEHGSFAAAARVIGVSNAAVSKNVRELEADLGVRLFHRTTRVMRLTEAGVLYHQRMHRLLSELDEADDAVTRLGTEPQGRLRVTVPMSVGLLRITPLLPRFLEQHPDVVLELHLSDEQDDLIHKDFDLAVRVSAALPDSTLVARRLVDLEYAVVASPSYLGLHAPVKAPEDLAQHACLLYANSEYPGRWTLHRESASSAREQRTIRVSGPLVANNSLAIRDSVLAGLGIALMPRLYVEDELHSGALINVLDGWTPPHRSLRAIYLPGSGALPRVRAFIDFLAHHFGESRYQ